MAQLGSTVEELLAKVPHNEEGSCRLFQMCEVSHGRICLSVGTAQEMDENGSDAKDCCAAPHQIKIHSGNYFHLQKTLITFDFIRVASFYSWVAGELTSLGSFSDQPGQRPKACLCACADACREQRRVCVEWV